jgi:hypothetical protein
MPDSASGEVKPEVAPAPERLDAEPDAPRPEPYNVVLMSVLAFFLIGFGVWVVSAGARYRSEYAQIMEGWRVGSTRIVELTLVKEDKRNLACASDQVMAGLRCGYRRNGREAGSMSPENPNMLQPYNTVGNELLLGAGLWRSPDLKEPLPHGRFSVICNYNIKGVARSVSIRFDPAAAFSAVGKTVTSGTLTDCVLPR